MSSVIQLVHLGLLAVPSAAANPKPPGSVARTSEDKKSVVLSIDLSACTPTQLQSLAKILNVTATIGASASGTQSTGVKK